MYKSPIEIFETSMQQTVRFDKEKDALIYKAVQGVHVNVDEEELLNALKYDRQQYNKGFEDGVKEFAKLLVDKSDAGLISVSDIPDYAAEMYGKRMDG